MVCLTPVDKAVLAEIKLLKDVAEEYAEEIAAPDATVVTLGGRVIVDLEVMQTLVDALYMAESLHTLGYAASARVFGPGGRHMCRCRWRDAHALSCVGTQTRLLPGGRRLCAGAG